jgi:hypothetical protein
MLAICTTNSKIKKIKDKKENRKKKDLAYISLSPSPVAKHRFVACKNRRRKKIDRIEHKPFK